MLEKNLEQLNLMKFYGMVAAYRLLSRESKASPMMNWYPY